MKYGRKLTKLENFAIVELVSGKDAQVKKRAPKLNKANRKL